MCSIFYELFVHALASLAEYSLTVLWPRNDDFAIKFEYEGVGINTIVLFFSDINQENIIYLFLKAV